MSIDLKKLDNVVQQIVAIADLPLKEFEKKAKRIVENNDLNLAELSLLLTVLGGN